MNGPTAHATEPPWSALEVIATESIFMALDAVSRILPRLTIMFAIKALIFMLARSKRTGPQLLAKRKQPRPEPPQAMKLKKKSIGIQH